VRVVRVWTYGVNLHLSQMKAHFRSSCFLIESIKTSRIYRYRWLGSTKFSIGILCGITALFSIVMLAEMNFSVQYQLDPISQTCMPDKVFMWTLVAFILHTYFITVVMLLVFYPSRDLYLFKPDARAGTLTRAVLLVGVLYGSYATPHMLSRVPCEVFLLLSQTATFFAMTVIPLLYAHRFDRTMCLRTAAKREVFRFLLDLVEFRNHFHEFLTKHFCQENLQFYELVMEWKMSQVDKAGRAKMIIENFIQESALAQIHLEGKIYDDIITRCHKNEFPDTLFDEAVEAVVHDMYTNSFSLFTATTTFKEMTPYG